MQKNNTIIPIEVKEKLSEEDVKKFFRITKKFNLKNAVILTVGEKVEKEHLLIHPIYLSEKLKELVMG